MTTCTARRIMNSTRAIPAMLIGMLFVNGCASTQKSPEPEEQPETEETETLVAAPAEPVITEDTPAPEIEPLEVEPPPPAPVYLESIGIAFLEPVHIQENTTPVQAPVFIEATGYGFPAANTTNTLQKMLTATEAAQYRAMASLAEKHSGLDVERQAKTIDMAFAEETVQINLSSSLFGVSEIDRTYDEQENMATITLRMMLPPLPEKESREEQLARKQNEAEQTARAHASALLREKTRTFMETEKVAMNPDEVAELLEETLFSKARWTADNICEVKASLRIDSTVVNLTPDPITGPPPPTDSTTETEPASAQDDV